MGKLKGLAGDTIIYGLSTIVGRLLNWLLMPFYVRTLPIEEYGVVSNLYAYITYFLIILTFGFETGFFRFAKSYSKGIVLKTLGSTVFSWSVLFVLIIWTLKGSIQKGLGEYLITEQFILLTAIIVAIDAITSIPFANLRFTGKSKLYAGLRFLQVIITVFFNVLFLVVFPWLIQKGVNIPGSLFDASNKVQYVFISNVISSGCILVFLLPYFFKGPFRFDAVLLKKCLNYSYPIVIVGFFGMVIQNIDKVLMPYLLPDGLSQLAIYTANFKIGVLMALFIQSFRLAFEPFFFKEGKENASKEMYGKILKYFVIAGMLIFVGVMQWLDVINFLLVPEYTGGNVIIPFVLFGQLMFGIYYSLSLWYKLTDKTYYGAIISGIGALIVIVGNLLYVPVIGYIGAAISSMLAFIVMTIISYVLGQRFYHVPYPVKTILMHLFLGIIVVLVSNLLIEGSDSFQIVLKGTIFVGYLFVIYFLEGKDFKRLI